MLFLFLIGMMLRYSQMIHKLEKFYFIFYVYECFSCSCICAPYVCSAHRGQKRALELDLHGIVICYVGARNWLRSSVRESGALNHRAVTY